ncbi:hypothetical protein QYM36_006571 [Artemia franciscana]|uniref:Uncharacterized protein n=1 Tax=Artemia franciscana TaxID=6661 RepID=A0AA88HYY7_ARTSF|nr:hypothetical protein QYM36_006571 [Artemia franciscana]
MNKIEEPTSWTSKISATPERQTTLTATAIIHTETTTAEPDTSIPKEVPPQKIPKKRTAAKPAIRPSEAEKYMDEENIRDEEEYMDNGAYEEKEQSNDEEKEQSNDNTLQNQILQILVSHWREEKHKYINFTEILRSMFTNKENKRDIFKHFSSFSEKNLKIIREQNDWIKERNKLEEERQVHTYNNGQQVQRFKDFLSHVETTITDEDFKSISERHKISGLADIFSFGRAILLMMDKRDKLKKYRSMLTELLEIPTQSSKSIIFSSIVPSMDSIIEFLEKYSDGSTSDPLTTDVKELLRSIDKNDLKNEEILKGFEKIFEDHPKFDTKKNLFFRFYEAEHGPERMVPSIKDKLKSFRNSVDEISYEVEDYAKYVQEKEKRRIITHVGLDNTQSSKGSQYKNPTFLSIIFLVLIIYQINN